MLDLKALALPFPAASISWRVGSTTADKTRGMALAYIDARDVMERLDDVCGVGGWQATYPHAGQKTVCSIGILCGDHWVWKSNGAGDSDIEAEKGALSDAFKRAAVLWGVGRYLYSLPSPWVELETKGRTSIIKPAELDRLADILTKHTAGMKIDNPPPPPDQDVMAAATRWTNDACGLLDTMANEDDVLDWNTKFGKALKKLQGTSEPLYERVMLAYGRALDRTRRGLAA